MSGAESPLEAEIHRRYVLEAAALQKQSLPAPRSWLERPAHPTLPPAVCCPYALRGDTFDAAVKVSEPLRP